MTPKPYIPRPWQLPHMLATPVGGKVLIVERCKEPVEEDGDWIWLLQSDDSKIGQHKDDSESISRTAKRYCPLGPVGTVLACKETWGQDFERVSDSNPCGIRFKADWTNEDEADEYRDWRWYSPVTLPHNLCRLFTRITDIDLRRVDTITGDEFISWGAGIIETLPNGAHGVRSAEERYVADNPGATWGDWAWFITAERTERCD